MVSTTEWIARRQQQQTRSIGMFCFNFCCPKHTHDSDECNVEVTHTQPMSLNSNRPHHDILFVVFLFSHRFAEDGEIAQCDCPMNHFAVTMSATAATTTKMHETNSTTLTHTHTNTQRNARHIHFTQIISFYHQHRHRHHLSVLIFHSFTWAATAAHREYRVHSSAQQHLVLFIFDDFRVTDTHSHSHTHTQQMTSISTHLFSCWTVCIFFSPPKFLGWRWLTPRCDFSFS